MAETTIKYPSIADVMRDLTLFFKADQDARLSLADFPKIAEGRWDYFRNNWDFIKNDYLVRIQALPDTPGKTAALVQFKQFGELVDGSRASSQNPLANQANIRKYKDLLDNIQITDIEVTQAEQNLIDRDMQRVARLQKDDFYQMRERVRITHDKTTDSLGLSDPDYDNLYERVASPQIISFRFQDFQVLESLIELKDTITGLIPTTLVQNERPDPFAQIRAQLNNAAIPMNSYQTGFLVPFPAGSTLERLAAQYLGSADRWMEIAVANGLQFPFVDEVGEKVMLAINGIGNIIIVDIDQFPNFGVDDEVFVGSAAVVTTRRKIVNIEEDKNNDQLILTLDGPADLQNFLTTQRAYVFHYKRNTINSSKFIMIPSQGSLGFPINAQEPWFVKNLSQDQKNMGVDLALSADDDLVFDSTDDLQLIYGLANAAQAANLKVKIKAKELLRNPTFGFEEIAGRFKNNEISESLLLLLIETAMGGDDRFDGTDGLGYTVTNNAIFINVSIRLSGSSSSIPLTFQIPKG
jgi:hypothetical protein